MTNTKTIEQFLADLAKQQTEADKGSQETEKTNYGVGYRDGFASGFWDGEIELARQLLRDYFTTKDSAP